MYPAWFLLHELLLVGSTAALLLAAPLGQARRPLVAAALALVPVQLGVLLKLASYGPDFALERLPLGLPLTLLTLVAGLRGPGLRIAATAAVLQWHLLLVPPTSRTAVLGTGLAYLVLLAGAAVLRAPRRTRPVRVVAGGLVAVTGIAVTGGVLGAVSDRTHRLPVTAHAGHAELRPGQVDVATLTGPAGRPDRSVTLTAQRSGDRWTYDGTVPGPELRFRQGELVAVTLVNRDVPAGVTLHWHGLDVPNAEDGVAGVTQDAVRPGGRHVYRFRPDQVGTFWYHSHQLSSEQVGRGLAGVVIVEPRARAGADLAVLDHPRSAAVRAEVAPGTPVRLRIVNAQETPQRYALAGVPFRVLAVDGTDLSGPTTVADRKVRIAAGGRYDLGFVMPAGPVALRGGVRPVEIRPPGSTAPLPPDRARGTLDLLSYGTPAPTPFGPDTPVDREQRLVIDQRIAFGGHGLGYQWAMNGQVWPAGPVLTVRTGDLVRTTIVNRSTADHPMHLHGHHSLVVSRDGVRATGSPWWTDTLNVAPGETYEVLFRADNPGIWMDHCHNLRHAAAGFVLHLAYEGVGTRFRIGSGSGNTPE